MSELKERPLNDDYERSEPKPEPTERERLDAEFGGWTDCSFCGEPVQVGHHCSECSRFCEDYCEADKASINACNYCCDQKIDGRCPSCSAAAAEFYADADKEARMMEAS